MDWTLECLACGATSSADGLPTVCACGQPWLVRYPDRRPGIVQRAEVRRRHGMWRFREFLPLRPFEEPVSLGEGDTPLLKLSRTATRLGVPHLLLKDEGTNPTGSFKARGLSAAMTRAHRGGGATLHPADRRQRRRRGLGLRRPRGRGGAGLSHPRPRRPHCSPRSVPSGAISSSFGDTSATAARRAGPGPRSRARWISPPCGSPTGSRGRRRSDWSWRSSWRGRCPM